METIRDAIDPSTNTTPALKIKSLFSRVELRQVPVSVNQKNDLKILSYYFTPFCSPM